MSPSDTYVLQTGPAGAAAGEVARIADNVPMRLCIVDSTRAIMSLRDPSGGTTLSTTVLVEHVELAQCLSVAFESIWTDAMPLDEALRDIRP